MHFTPTSASWLNLVERWFREIIDKKIRRGVFKSVDSLVAAIVEYLEANNANPKPFVWTASMRLLKKRCRIYPAGGLGVSPSFISPPRLGDSGG